jgi:7-cyano-7-deazaguanine synthase
MEQEKNKKAVVLLSGGLDSATILARAIKNGYQVCAISFSYGQRHIIELEKAKQIAKTMGASEHRIIDIDLASIGGSALTSDIDVPKNSLDQNSDIPITYVPARNTIFLSYALAVAEVLGSKAIFIGVNVLDYSGYPDCRPEYIEAFEHMANLATRAGVEAVRKSDRLKIHTPLIHLTKAEIIIEGTKLGVDYSKTISCYDPSDAGLACGSCDSCLLRKNGFEDAGIPDPTKYAKS